MHYTACLRSLLWITLLSCATTVARAQPAEGEAPAALPPPSDPVIKVLITTNPQSPENIVGLIETLIDLREPKYAGPFLQKLVDLNLDEDQQIKLYQRVGSAFFLKLAAQKDLLPRGKEYANQVLETVRTRVRDPNRLNGLIDKLADPTPGAKRAALLELQLGQDVAVQALLAALVDDNRAEAHPHVEEALSLFGSEPFEPIAALVREGNDGIKRRALNVLARLDHPDVTLYALHPAFAPQSSAELRAAAQKILARERITTAGDAAGRLYLFARDYFVGRRSLPSDENGATPVWRWDAAAGQLSLTKRPVQASIYEQAMRFARDARQLAPQNIEVRRLYLSALVEAGLAISGKLEVAASIKQQLAQEGVPGLTDLVEYSLATSHPRVAAIALNVIGDLATAEVLRTSDGRPGVIARALRNPERDVRYAALEAIAKLGPLDTFPGSSYVGEALQYFIRAEGMSRAVVADPRPINAAALGGIVQQMGHSAIVTHDRSSALKAAINSADIALIVVDMFLALPESDHLLTSLRRDARTARVPILIVISEPADEPHAETLARKLGLAGVIPGDASAKQFTEALNDLGAPTSPAEARLAQARNALLWLAAMDTNARQRYGWRQLEKPLLAALEQPALSAAAAPLLGELGSISAQVALLQFASNPAWPRPLREVATKAFQRTVSTHGLLLTAGQLQTQYDIYNASETQPRAEQILLGALLDVIEGRPLPSLAAPLPAPMAPAAEATSTEAATSTEVNQN